MCFWKVREKLFLTALCIRNNSLNANIPNYAESFTLPYALTFHLIPQCDNIDSTYTFMLTLKEEAKYFTCIKPGIFVGGSRYS